MFKKILALLLICTLSTHAMTEQINAGNTMSESDFNSALELIAHSKDLNPQEKSRITRNAVICFAVGATIGITAVAACACSCYGYAHYQESKTLNKLKDDGSKTNKNLLLPDPQQDLPWISRLKDVGVACKVGRVKENLKEDLDSLNTKHIDEENLFKGGKFTSLHYAASDWDVSAKDIKEVLEETKIEKNHAVFNLPSQEDKDTIVNNQAFEVLKGSTPLALAALDQNSEKVALFLEYGANPLAQDDQGNTALHNAVYLINPSDSEYADPGRAQQKDIVNTLIQSNPKIKTIKNKAGFTPLDYMRAREQVRTERTSNFDHKKPLSAPAQKHFNELEELLSKK